MLLLFIINVEYYQSTKIHVFCYDLYLTPPTSDGFWCSSVVCFRFIIAMHHDKINSVLNKWIIAKRVLVFIDVLHYNVKTASNNLLYINNCPYSTGLSKRTWTKHTHTHTKACEWDCIKQVF